MKKLIGIFLMLAVLVFACKKQEPTPAQVEEIYFEQNAPTKLDEGDDINLSSYLVISPEAVADTVTVEWSSSNEEIATIGLCNCSTKRIIATTAPYSIPFSKPNTHQTIANASPKFVKQENTTPTKELIFARCILLCL